MRRAITYRTAEVDGLPIFWREAGDPHAPALLLLHGLPSSSRMYQPLLERLSGRYRLVAPDYPGFGHSAAPEPAVFPYTFDRLAEVMIRFTEHLGLSRYSLFLQDYGGPVGFRMALAHPERLEALIIQNAVAHETGLGPAWVTRRAFWADRAANEAALRVNLLSPEATRRRHVGDDPAVEHYDPDLWTDELAFLGRPGQSDIQTKLFHDYGSNVAAYPAWQDWLRRTRPRLLVLWGRHDPSFDLSEPEAYRRDVPGAEIHILDAGHFALDTEADRIAALVGRFLQPTGNRNPTMENDMKEDEIVDSSFTATIHAPLEKIDIPAWCFSLSEQEYQGCSPAHLAAGFTTAPDGRRMSINVEIIGGSLMVQHYVETLGRKDHLILESVSDVFTPSGRTTIHVHWEMSVKPLESGICEFTNRVRSTATPEFKTFLDRQGIPFDVFRAQRQPMSIAHNRGETPLFAASIERVAIAS